MIKLNLSNAVTEKAIEKYQPSVKVIANQMERLESVGYEYLGWKDLPETYDKSEYRRMMQTKKRLIKEEVDTLVVIGVGGAFSGSKAAIDMILGEFKNNKGMEIVYLGNSLSSTNVAQKLLYLQNKNFAINIISKFVTIIEPGIAFRLAKKLLEDKVGINNASKFVIVTTDPNNGELLKIAKEKNYELFFIPQNIRDRFSVLTPVGLFPMICAGINVKKILIGALRAHRMYSKETLIGNDAYRYAVARRILMNKYQIELLVSYESQMMAFNEWWKHLAGESEGKSGKGLFPSSAIFSTDLHSLGQYIQDGNKIIFETVITMSVPNIDVPIIGSHINHDQLNYLSDKDMTVHQVNEAAFKATSDAHVNVGKVPNIHLEVDKMDEENFGWLVIFFQRAVTMTAYLQGVNPFDQPGVEIYKQNMFKILEKQE